jgi:hypothetical protein
MTCRFMTRGGAALVLLALGISLISLSCSSRYRLDLFLQTEGQRQRVDVESTQYVIDAQLGNVLADTKVKPGAGNVVIATAGTRWSQQEKAGLSIIGYDEYLRTRLFLELPERPNPPDSFDLSGNSFVTIVGRYDWAPEDKAFLPRQGFFRIDSIASERVFLTVNGEFRNRNRQDLLFEGQFKVKAEVRQ